MDAVYVTRDGENPELRYSLRSLQNVPHNDVWIFGGVPSWVDTENVKIRPNRQESTPYRSTLSHIEKACDDIEVSDPFLLWNDDYYAMKPTVVPVLHRGTLDHFLEASTNTPWWKGLRETHALLKEIRIENPMCYEVHAPLVIHKRDMQHAIRLVKKNGLNGSALRSVYGNIAPIGGHRTEDPKMFYRSDLFPQGDWLSSGPSVFHSTVEPVLRYLFPYPSIYERV